MYSDQHSNPISDQKLNGGPWNQQQCLKYLIFLDQNKIVMASRQKKKRFRVFDQMSDFIETRSSLQCRSHHQKAIEKYKHVKDIISHQKLLVDMKQYRLKLKQLRQNAKVKENYEKLGRPKVIKESVQVEREIKEVKDEKFQLTGFPVIPNFFNSIQAYQFQMFPMAPNPMLSNYFYCPFFALN